VSQNLILKKGKREYLKWWKKMDLHEEDKNHLQNAWEAAMWILEKYNWVKIDCERDWEMRSIEDINEEIMLVINN
jgi:dTMP kinase